MSRDNNALENGSTIWEKIGYMKQLYDEFKGFFLELCGLESDVATKSLQSSIQWENRSSVNKFPKIDTSEFSPWDYPFAHIPPYKWIPAYDLRKLKFTPGLPFSGLKLKGTEWLMTTLKVKDYHLKLQKNTAGYKKNNPCNISPSKSRDIGLKGASKVADGQNHAQYETLEDGLASYMKMIREQKDSKGNYMYRNKSLQWINCWWMQWVYRDSEPDSLKALRIVWITNASKQLQVDPLTRLNTDDKETLMALAQQTAITESSSYFDRATLERAYQKAFW